MLLSSLVEEVYMLTLVCSELGPWPECKEGGVEAEAVKGEGAGLGEAG